MVRTKRRWVLAVAAALAVGLVSGCAAGDGNGGGGGSDDGDAGTLNLYSFTEPTSWDPAAFVG